MPFGFTDLEKAISKARAGRYLQSATNDVTGTADPGRALQLYEHNMRLSAELWGTIGAVEVVIRNVLAETIAARHAHIRPGILLRWYDGPSWLDPGEWFTSHSLVSIDSAKRRAGDRGPGPLSERAAEGKVVAELTLGFWRYLLVARYEHSLWNPALRAMFAVPGQLSGSDSRKEVYRRVEALNYLRNRVAHHEPIYEPFQIPGQPSPAAPDQIVHEAIELVSWTNPIAADWIQTHDSFVSSYAACP